MLNNFTHVGLDLNQITYIHNEKDFNQYQDVIFYSMHQENKIITIEEMSKVNLCVGRIVSAEQIPNKQKILKTVVDIGSELRDVVAQIYN